MEEEKVSSDQKKRAKFSEFPPEHSMNGRKNVKNKTCKGYKKTYIE